MNFSIIKKTAVALTMALLTLPSCRKGEPIISSETTKVTDGQDGEIKGFFLLNQGNMGSNKATLDYFDYASGEYTRNIYAERNPNVASELGDVGNDIKIWGSKLYAVINNSNLVEVMDVTTVKHIEAVSVPNCRYLAFKDNYAYVSSYAGEVSLNNPNARRGYVAKIDTATLEVVATCDVGYQPEQMVIVGDKMYVANSGGYMAPDYDNTISVVDLESFTEEQQIEVAINLHCLELAEDGKLWISSRGNHKEVASKTYTLDLESEEVVEYPLLPNSTMTIVSDLLYILSYSESSSSATNTLVNSSTGRTIKRNFVDEQTFKKMAVPYSIAINPYNKEIFITDAGDYVTPGKVYCFKSDGTFDWSAETGDAPASIVFTNRALGPLN